MGLLVNGVWRDQWYDTDSTGGEFVRESAKLRDWVTADGSQGPQGVPGVPAEADRYHLYVSLACPWAHRTLIMRQLKGLRSLIGVSYTSPLMLENGWSYNEAEGSSGDSVNGVSFHHQLYTLTDPHYTGRVTVPALWDKQQGRIINNESAELVRMFNGAFDALTGNRNDLYPEFLRDTIDEINADVYENVNNGVYKAGFATDQAVYERQVSALFACLDRLESRLANHRYLAGAWLTEADIRLFTTLVRFDAVYHGHFKCNLYRIEDYPNLSHYLRELYQWPGIADTVNMEHIQRHYYMSHVTINPNRIVPKGPALTLDRQHDRARLKGEGIHQRG
ncbi:MULTISPECIES: glutathione S-transferase family protein [Halomonas]|uniref:glutathione S-transferase family protein n=1 Tax=Halomonas TaxID=2745 RepID=UPI001C97EAB0|nr:MULTISPECIES: glutathione S-transferase family protein [Halomonas]MBY6208847.1 glutathione S-transferase family protein [Halomonas sp. DP3Y7-2]MBY6227317.1 glutathione S-transferase family protein [Halomonas sp. DP3Y7-1]MCA0914933.1 glutathione S-transferase family protein [Halomonas denitrificans]